MAITKQGGDWHGAFGFGDGLRYRENYRSDFDRIEDDAKKKDLKAQLDASNLPHMLKQQRFDTVFPWLQGQLGSAFSGGGMASAGGQSPPSPEITVGGVWNPQQVQQQVNAARAGNDQTTAKRVQSAGQDMASRGFGSSSPLLQALQGQAYAANLGTNTTNEREIRNNAGQQNAQHLLGTQSARENQFASREKADIARRAPYWQTMNSLVGALSGLV